MGKQLGKEIGEWFGPSTAAGAIKSLVNAFEPAGLKVVNFVDGTVYASEVESAAKEGSDRWEKPVLILIGLRLGIDGVNPVYHESIKVSGADVVTSLALTTPLCRTCSDSRNLSASLAVDLRLRTTLSAAKLTHYSTSTPTFHDRPCRSVSRPVTSLHPHNRSHSRRRQPTPQTIAPQTRTIVWPVGRLMHQTRSSLSVRRRPGLKRKSARWTSVRLEADSARSCLAHILMRPGGRITATKCARCHSRVWTLVCCWVFW